jgi:LacI family transcriptional regulator
LVPGAVSRWEEHVREKVRDSGAGRINIQRVAREADVSIKTVSRVINDRPDVAPETRERVQAIIKRLGFRPNPVARSLVSRRSQLLGVINPDFTDDDLMPNMLGIELEARRRGFSIVLGSTELSAEGQPGYSRLRTEHYVEGMLFLPPTDIGRSQHIPEAEYLQDILDLGIFVVTLKPYPMIDSERLIVVDVDNVTGGMQATEHLLALGHRRIATITGAPTSGHMHTRLEGYRRALEAAGVAYDLALVAHADWTHAGGRHAMQKLLASDVNFSAVFVMNDRMAMGAIQALNAAGRRIPDNISIVGFDDSHFASAASPALTTVHQPIAEVGRTCMRLLIDAIEAGQARQRYAILRTHLIERESTRAAS